MIQWNDCSIIIFFSNLILHWVKFLLLLFLLRTNRGIPLFFPHFLFSFLRQWRLLEMNQLESWIYLEIGKLEFLVVFATFVYVAGFFWTVHPSAYTSKCICLFLHFSLMLPLPLYWNIFICIFDMCTFLAFSLPFSFSSFFM